VDFQLTKNIIFDFGAVIINIDIPKAYRAFSDLSGIPAETVKQLFEAQGAYADFESGKMSNDGFRALLRQELNISSSDEQLDDAWNAMLLDIPLERIEKLKDLKTRYNIYLLSNTNAIHKKKIQEMFLEQFGIEDFTNLFHKKYLSYEIGLLKPHPSIYEHVLQDLGLNKKETIFLDDNADNVKSALSIGLPTIQVLPGEYTMMEILKNA
jgi:HAD superfamily hydrolase (TIGR01509 family)